MTHRSRFALCVIALLSFTPSIGHAQAKQKKPFVLPKPPAGVVIEQDLTFLDPDRKERLDLYRPEKHAEGQLLGAIVMIHGGGWVGGDKAAPREFEIGATFAQRGYVCVSVNYMMEQGKRWPTNLLDCKNAVRFLRKNADKYHIDPHRIGVIGGSAGGHLALMVAYTTDVPDLEPQSPYPGISSKVGAVVDLYGITNLMTRRKTDSDGTPIGEPGERQALLTVTKSQDPAAWKQASPVTHVSKNSPPTLILHGAVDATVDRDQATELASRLKDVGAEHELMLLPDLGHSFTLRTWKKKPISVDLVSIVGNFFDKHLLPKAGKP